MHLLIVTLFAALALGEKLLHLHILSLVFFLTPFPFPFSVSASAPERVTIESHFSLPNGSHKKKRKRNPHLFLPFSLGFVGWERKELVASDVPLKLIFAIKQSNLDLLESTLLAVSNPKSPEFVFTSPLPFSMSHFALFFLLEQLWQTSEETSSR